MVKIRLAGSASAPVAPNSTAFQMAET